jgi:type I restriction-modification system DNA methylase subunit
MAIKKSELYSSLWSSCDLLRGGMDASQYNAPYSGVTSVNYGFSELIARAEIPR